MSSTTVHLISFTVPYPPVYGGVMDVFYKLKALSEQGIKIILHCWKYDTGEQPELEKYCTKVYYYARKNSPLLHLSLVPYIVCSRTSDALLKNLLQDHHPIIFEGIHTTALLQHPSLKARRKIVRQHNIEWSYYKQLAQTESSWWKKVYYQLESKKLKTFEKKTLKSADSIAVVSEYDSREYPGSVVIPVFQSMNEIACRPTIGKTILYQADLSVTDNAEGAMQLALMSEELDLPLIIAGWSAPEYLRKLSEAKRFTLVCSPEQQTMQALTEDAQINVINSRINSGMKIKLLQLLLNGRWCFVNRELQIPQELEPLVVRYSVSEFSDLVKQYSTRPLTTKDFEERKRMLSPYLPSSLVKKLIAIL